MWYGHGMQSELVISLNHVLVPIQDLSQPLLWALYLSQFFAYRTQLIFHVIVSEASECANSNNVTLPPPFVTQSQQSKMPIPGRTWFTCRFGRICTPCRSPCEGAAAATGRAWSGWTWGHGALTLSSWHVHLGWGTTSRPFSWIPCRVSICKWRLCAEDPVAWWVMEGRSTFTATYQSDDNIFYW